MTDLQAETARLIALRKKMRLQRCLSRSETWTMLDHIEALSAQNAALQAEAVALTARAEAAEAEVGRDDNLIFDAYKALLVLHRILDKTGLSAGTRAAQQIADRIVAAHPEVVARATLAEIGGGND